MSDQEQAAVVDVQPTGEDVQEPVEGEIAEAEEQQE
jgi:hypothetical protein